MAIIGTNPYIMNDAYHLIDPSKLPTTDNILSTVQGEMLYAEIVMTEFMLSKISSGMTDDEFKEHIKKELCQRLVAKLFASKMIEFTHERRVDTDEPIYRARIFATPDNKVQLIRQVHQSIK
jgi:hypothetical protein